jgi:hypothetical protein
MHTPCMGAPLENRSSRAGRQIDDDVVDLDGLGCMVEDCNIEVFLSRSMTVAGRG